MAKAYLRTHYRNDPEAKKVFEFSFYPCEGRHAAFVAAVFYQKNLDAEAIETDVSKWVQEFVFLPSAGCDYHQACDNLAKFLQNDRKITREHFEYHFAMMRITSIEPPQEY
jgi:hypothetical protein